MIRIALCGFCTLAGVISIAVTCCALQEWCKRRNRDRIITEKLTSTELWCPECRKVFRRGSPREEVVCPFCYSEKRESLNKDD